MWWLLLLVVLTILYGTVFCCHCYCRDLELFVGLCAVGVFASRCRVVVEVSLVVAYDFVWDSVSMTGNYTIYFQFQEDAGYFCVLNAWFSSNDEICADNNNYSRFKLKDKCRSAKWEVYLTVLMTIKVDRDCVVVLPRCRFLPYLATGHTPSLILPAF